MTPAPRTRSGTRNLIAATALAAVGVIAVASVVARSQDDGGGAVVQQAGAPRIVFAEFGLNEDQIYTAPADSPDERAVLASVPHAPGWGINPATAASGSLVAYTVLPREADPTRESPAELWVLDVSTENLTRLARDADLLIPPVFVEDGRAVLYRRSHGPEQEVVRVSVDDLTREVVHREQTAFGIFPIGLRGAALLFARLSTEGTDVFAVEGGSEPEFVLHASDDIARDWRISPDGEALSYLAPVEEAERVVYRAHAVSLRTLEPIALDPDPASVATEQYGPVWTPDGRGLTVGQEAFAAEAEATLVLGLDGSRSSLATPESGFDVPLGWSEDGRYLAVRWFNGRNSMEPGAQRTVIVDREGGRSTIDVSTEVIFLGWYRRA